MDTKKFGIGLKSLYISTFSSKCHKRKISNEKSHGRKLSMGTVVYDGGRFSEARHENGAISRHAYHKDTLWLSSWNFM